MIEFVKCIATPSSLAHSLLSLHPLSPSLHTHILPLHSLPLCSLPPHSLPPSTFTPSLPPPLPPPPPSPPPAFNANYKGDSTCKTEKVPREVDCFSMHSTLGGQTDSQHKTRKINKKNRKKKQKNLKKEERGG